MSCFIHAFTVLFFILVFERKKCNQIGRWCGSSNGSYVSEQPETVVWCYPRMCVVTVLVLRPQLWSLRAYGLQVRQDRPCGPDR